MPDTPVDLTLRLVQEAETPTLQLVDDSGAVVASQALAGTWWVYVLGSDLDDVLTVDLGAWFAVPVTFHGGGHGQAGGDSLRVLGGGSHAASVRRDALLAGSGAVTVDEASVEFSEVEPVSVADMASLTITTSGSSDELTVDSPALGQGRVSGTSDGASFDAITFTNVVDVAIDTGVNDGTAGDDTVIIDDSVPGSGLGNLSIRTGQGSDTLVGPDAGATWTVTGADTGEVEGIVFGGVETLQGGTGSDTLVGADTDNTWTITGENAGTLNTLSFEGVENLTGGAGSDTFVFAAGGSLSGGLRGGAGIDRLVGADLANVWVITGVDAGTLNGQAFAEIENLVGGEDADIFVFAGGRVSGTVEGRGGANRFDYSGSSDGVIVDLEAGTATGTGGFAGITELIGSSGRDTLAGPAGGSTWAVTGPDTGTVGSVTFTGFENLSGGAGADVFALGALGSLSGALSGGDGDDAILAADLANDWEIVAPDAGFLNGLAFLGIETLLGGAADDVFVFALGGSITGAIAGGPGLDRVRGADKRNRWRITGNGSATLDGASLSGVEALEGGADEDEFIFDDGADFGGSLDGGAGATTLDYSAYTSDIAVDLASGSATGTTGVSGINRVVGGTGSDTLGGPATDATWTISGPNSGNVNGIEYSGVENLAGAPDNQDVFAYGPLGRVDGSISGGAGGFDTLAIGGGTYDTVVFTPAGPDSGSVTLDGVPVRYGGLEPISLTSPAPNIIFDLTDLTGATATLEPDTGTVADDDYKLSSPTGGFESQTFTDPGGLGTVRINLGAGNDTITLKNLLGADAAHTLDAPLTVSGGPGDDTFKLDDTWGQNVTLLEAAGEGTNDTLDFNLYSDAAPRDPITITPQGGGGVTINATSADGSSLVLSSTSADNFENLTNANINLTGLADPASDEIIGGLKDVVTFLRNVAGTATEFAATLPLLGGSADVAVAKALDFAEALDELRVQVEEFFAQSAVTSTPVTTDDLIAKLNTLFGGAGRTLAHLGASILSPRVITDADLGPANPDTDIASTDLYQFQLTLDGTAVTLIVDVDQSPVPNVSGSQVTVGFNTSAGGNPSAIDPEDLTVANLVSAMNLGLAALDTTAGQVIAAQRNGRIAFEVVGTEVDAFSVLAQAGQARTKLGFPVTAVSLTDVQDILRNLGSLNVKLASGVTLGVSWNSGEPQLRFDVNYQGTRSSNFFYNFGSEAQGMGLAFDLDAKLSTLAKLIFEVQLGLGLTSGGTTFFLDVDALRAGIETTLASDSVSNAGLNIGFLDVQASGSLLVDAGITATLSSMTGITSSQLTDAGVGLITGGSLSLTGFDNTAGFTGSPEFNVNLSISVETGLDSLGGFSATGTLTASGDPLTSGKDIDLTTNASFDANFPDFNNLNAAGVVSLVGQISGWLDQVRSGELLNSIDIPFVSGGLDAILDLAEVLDDALLYDEGPDNVKDGSDRLVTDLNQALAQARLDRLIRAQGDGARITLIAVDPEITGFTITKKLGTDPSDSLPFDGGGYADLGFSGSPTSSGSGDDPQTIVAGSDAATRGRLSGRAAFTVTVSKPGGPVTGDVRLAKEPTDSNEGVGDDVAKLTDANNTPLFSTAQDLAERLDEFIPGDVSFSTATKLLTYTIDFSDVPLFTVELPTDFSLDLGPILGVQSNTRLVIEAEGGFHFTLGFDLNDAPGGSAGNLTGATTLESLGVDVKQEEAATAQGAPRTIVGQLSGPATFTISYNPSGSVTVPLLRTGTDINVSHHADDQSETAIAVNPTDPDNIIVAVNDADASDGIFGSVSSNDHVYVTFNGGTTWQRKTIPVPAGTPAPASSHGDPTIVFSRDGSRAVFVHMVDKVPADHGGGNNERHVMVSAVSLDGGATWLAANTAAIGSFANDEDGDGFNDDNDKEYLAVGPRNALNPELDRFVLTWHRNNVIHASTSLDGLTWTAPAIVGGMTGGSSTAQPSGASIDAIPSIGPAGEIYVVWEEFGTPGVSRIMFDSSLDGGLTWGGGLDTAVFFDTGLFDLDGTDTGILDAVAVQLTANPQLLVTVAGYTDTAGDAGPNQTLSDNRADAVRDYLVDTKGIDASRIVILGFGETRLAVPTGNGVANAANRRAEITFDQLVYTGNVNVFNDFNQRAIISGASQGNPVEITTANPHQLTTGAQVFIEDVAGMTELNDRTFTVTVTGANTFTLNGENGTTGHTAYVSGGTFKSVGSISGATQANPAVITTPSAHGLVTGDTVHINNDVGGMTQIRRRNFRVTVLSPTTFSLDDVDSTGFGAYTSGGTWRVFDGYDVPAQPDRGIWMGLSVDVDRSGGAKDGRIYVGFADQGDLDGSNDHGVPDHDDTDIFVIASDDGGVTWNALASSPLAIGADQVRVNDDTGTASQFFSWLAVDQSTGNVAVSWYDARNDDGLLGDGDLNGLANDDVQYFAGVSTDFGRTWTNLRVSDGTSTARGTLGGDYGDYTGLAFVNGSVHMAWADTSDSTTVEAVNPDGDASFPDAYYDRIDLTNETMQDLLDDINAALDLVTVADGPDANLSPDVLGDKFEARASGSGTNVVELVALDPAITAFTVTVANTADPAFRDLGFQLSSDAVEDDSGDLVVKAGKSAPSFVGRLTADASFDITLAGGSPQTVTVPASATSSPFGANRSILDLVNDVQDAIDAVFTPAGPGQHVITVSSVGGKLLFTRTDVTPAPGSTSDGFTITAGTNAGQLGITGTLPSDEADLLITLADGTTTHRVVLGLDEDSDGDVDIDDVIAAIASDTGGDVLATISVDDPTTPVNEAGTGLTLEDTTWSSGSSFTVAATNGSLAGVELGIVGKDGMPVGQAGEPDGKIIGAKIAGATLLDRLFLTATDPTDIIDASLSVKAGLLVEDITVDNLAGTVVTSSSFEFKTAYVGMPLKLKGINGFTAGTYTINSVDESTNKATLSASVGDQGMTGGVGVIETGVDASAHVGFVNIDLESTTAKLGAELSLGFNTGSTAWTNDNRLTLREILDNLSDPLSLIAPPDWNPLMGETNFADLDLTVDISLDGASADFGGLASALLGATPGVTIDVKALGDPFLGTRFTQASYTKVNDTSFTVTGDFTTKLPDGVVIRFSSGGTDHDLTVSSTSFGSGMTTVNVTGSFALPSSLTGYDVTLQPKVDVDTSDVDLDNLLNFENIDFGDVLTALTALFSFLGQFEAFGFLNTDIPLINKSVNDLLSFASDFADDLQAAGENPAGALQVLETKINEAVGLSAADLSDLFDALQTAPLDNVLGLSTAPNDVVDLSLVSGSILKLDLALGKTFSGGLDVAIPGIDFGDGVFASLGLGNILDLSGSAGLFAEGSVMLRLQLGIDLQNPTDVYLFEDTGLEAELEVGGENIAFRVGVGPFALSIASTETQTSEISLSLGATLGFDPSTVFDSDGKLAIGDALASLDLAFSGEASGVLPVFFPSDSNLIGAIKIGEAVGAGFGQLENIGNFTIKTDDTAPASDDFVIDVSEIVDGITGFNFDSFNIFDNIFLAIDGIDMALEFVQNLVGGKIGDLSIPLVGDELAKGATFIEDFRQDFVAPLRKAVEDAQNMAQDFADPDENILSKLIFDLLAPKSVVGPNGLGLGLLKPLDGSLDSGDDSPADFIALDTNLQQYIDDPDSMTLSEVFIEWDFKIGSVLANLSPDIGFDLGIPGLGLKTEGNITLDVEWDLDLGFGLSGSEGFYLKVDDPHELLFDVSVGIPASISGTLGFLGLRAADKGIDVNGTTYHTGLNAMFAVDISEGGASGDDADRLGFTEFGSIDLDAKIAASASAALELELGLSPDLFAKIFGPDAAGIISGFPKLKSDFIFLWEVGTRGEGATLEARANDTTFVSLDSLGNALGDGLKLVAFQNVRLDLGTFLSDVLGPIVDEVAKFTAPMQPLIDFITSPIPIIGELGIEITWLDLAQMIAGDALNVRLIEAIGEVVTLINDIAAASGAGEIALPIGDMVLYNDSVLPGAPAFTSAALWDRGLDLGGVFDQVQGTSGLLNDLVGAAGGIGDAIGDLIGGLSGDQAQAATTLQNVVSHTSAGGFSFPFLENPSEIFGLLMGEPVDLVVYDLEPDPTKSALEFEFEWRQFFSIFGPLGVSIGLLVQFTADGKFGYDSLGIQQFVETGFRNPELLLNGFYIADDPKVEGVDDPELTFLAELQAAAELNLGIARAGVAAALGFLIEFDLFDPNNDMKIRIDELIGNVANQLRAPGAEKLLAPLAIFDVHGEIFAKLFAFLEIDFGFFSFEKEFPIFGPVTLLSFDVDFFRPPILASEQDTGDLIINAGQFAEQRLLGNATDVAEHLIIRSTGTEGDFVKVEVKSGDGALGEDSQTFLEYRVRKGHKIIIDGGEGDDIFDLSQFTADGVIFDINLGAGNDQVIWDTGAEPPAGRFNLIQGGPGDDDIEGSGGSDLIYGNSGNDTINAGGGSDLVFGDEGEVGDGFARGLVKPTDGRDTVDGGDGADIVFGGGGKDTVQGGAGSGTDLVLGGGGVVTFTSTSAFQVFGNFEVTGSVHDPEDLLFDPTAGDTILGGPDADILYGTAGPDTIQGGGGNDIIFGLGGFDTIDGGAGNDVIFGDDGQMVPDGDDLNTDDDPIPFAGGEADTIQGGAGADTIFGGGGADVIQGGDDDDDIYGGSGADTIFGDNGSIIGGVPTPAEGAGDDGDLIFGEGEPDRIFGGGGNDVIDGGAGNDYIDGGSGADSIITNKSNDYLDGGEGGDFYTVYFQGGTASSLMNVIDTGATGTDVFVALGTVFDDRFLLRANTDGSIAFVALINTVFHVERVNYAFVERVVVNGSFGDDYFASDDTSAEITLNGEFGDDIFQIGQMFKSNRGDQTDLVPPGGNDFSDVTGVAVDDAFANIETTRGWLSNGISAPMTINGGLGDDLFTVFHNKAVLQLNGEEGDDTFQIRAFALAGSQEPQRERTDISGGAGADLVQYAVNAPVNIDGGDGFDTVVVIGTEFGDDLVITEDGVFGAGLNVNFVRIESLRVDGAEGNDRFFVLSTSEKFMTEIFGGLGEDTFNMSGDTPPIVSNDLKGHSGLIVHDVESTDARYDGQELFGISANVADNDEPFAVIRTTGGSTIVTEGGSLVDSYQIVLTRQPTKDVLIRALAPIPTPGDRERRAMAFRLDSPTEDDLSSDGTSLTLRFTAADWYVPQTVNVYADDAPLVDTSVSAAFGLFTRPEIAGEDPDADLTTGIPFDMNDDAYEGVRYGVINHLVSAASDILEGTIAGINNATSLVVIPDTGIVSADEIVGRKLFVVKGKGAGQLRSVLESVSAFGFFFLTVDRPFNTTDVPTTSSDFFLAIDDALVGTVSDFDETPSGLPVTTEPEDKRSTFTDSAAAFPTAGQGLRGAVLEIIGGPGAGQQRLILGNLGSDPTHTLILNGPWREDPVAGESIYRIERYDGLAIPSVTVQINDDDQAGVIVDEAHGFQDDGDGIPNVGDVVDDSDTITAVIEGGNGDYLGEQDVLRIRLSRDPGAEVHLGLSYPSQLEVHDLSGNLITTGNPLVFDSTTWDDFQIVRVTATDDTLREGFHTGLIQFTITQGTSNETLDQTDDFNLIPEESAVFFVGLGQNPVAGSTVVTLNGDVLTEGADITTPGADYIVLSNKIVFLDGTGDLQAVFGTISVEYEYVNPGFSSAFTAPVLARIQDADAPTVLVRETGGSTDVIELSNTGTGPDSIQNAFAYALIQGFNLSPWNDSYELVLTGQPTDDVTITVAPQVTKTTRTGGIRTDAVQVTISSDDSRVTAGPEVGQLTVTFDDTNWDQPVVIKVQAIDDAEVDGGDTQVFAPGPDTVSGILGPVFVQGAGGEGSLAMQAPLMLPGEINKRPADGDVIAFTPNATPGAIERMTVLTSVLEAKRIALGFDSIDDLIGLTIEMAEGNGTNVLLNDNGTPTPFDDKVFDRFWLIVDIVDGGAGQKILHLQNPSQLDVGSLLPSAVPNASSKFAITTLSANFFVDETTQVDFMFVHDEDSLADHTGYLTPTRLYGMNMGPDLVIGGQLRPGGVTFDELEVLEINLGKGNNTFNVLGTPTRREDGYQTWTFLNSGDETVPWFGVMGDMVNVTLNAADELVRAGTVSATANPALANGFKNTVTVDGTILADDALQGYVITVGATGSQQTRRIIGNTGNVLWIDRGWDTLPTGQAYTITNEADGAFAVNAQAGNDTVNASTSGLGITIFGGLGNDILTGGSGDDVIFGDRGRVDYFNEIDAVVTRLGYAPEPITGFVTAQVVAGTPGAGETDLFHMEDTGAKLSGGAAFGTSFPVPDDVADGLGTDDIGLRGLYVDINNGFGFLQTIKLISDNTGTTLELADGFDPDVDLPGPVSGDESEYRISTYPEDQTDGVVRGANLLITVDNDLGGTDRIYGGAGTDQIFGGAGDDEIHAGADDDLVIGDAGRLDRERDAAAPDTPEIGEVVGSTYDLLRTIATAFGGEDEIYGDGGDDIILGGTASDTIQGGDDNDIALGDFGQVTFFTTNEPQIVEITFRTLGAADTMRGGAGEDVLAGGVGADRIDGQSGDDLVFGDNVRLDWQAGMGAAVAPRFRQLSGTTIYDANGNPQVGTAWQNNPAGMPAWADWTMTFGEAAGGANSTGNDYIAGGADDDTIFGQLGDDVIQGDGAIDSLTDDGIAVGAYRDGAGLLQVSASFEAATDGDDYIEGNAGADVVFGNLGQDDIIGGSSSLFSLNAPGLRPDGADLLFGGAGTDIARNNLGDLSAEGHARDADMILGDNGNVFRLVNGSGFLQFTYDNYNTLKIKPRAAQLLDYTPGGPDYANTTASGWLVPGNIGAADELHGESGDDFLYGMAGGDVLFGEGQDDDIIGGYGGDWISGGSGQDGVIGDDGRIFTSRNGLTEPLNGVTTATIQTTIATPGNMQTAVINVTGELKKSVDLTPFNVDPDVVGQDPLFDPIHADDMIYGGLGSDFLHGGSGDDAISGAEALELAAVTVYPEDGTINAARTDGTLVLTGYDKPVNPLLGNALGHEALRAEELAAYDEFDPWSKIYVEDTVNGITYDYFLNFDEDEGPAVVGSLVHTDGSDAIFGDVGNDWLVGGTGRDNLYGGWGNDLLNADDDLTTSGGANTTYDGPEASYEDRAYGGAGRDVLIANTGGDRLIDWVGEFNAYIVPFAPFGAAVVSRTLQPQLPEFLYALSKADGADQTRASAGNAARNGEPDGELGLVIQKDLDWQAQTGAPDDPQPGNIPGGRRDVLRSADFNTGNMSLSAFAPDSGVWTVGSGELQVTAASIGSDAVSVFHVDHQLPAYFEIIAQVKAEKPLFGWNANAYVIFDYVSARDFKFAGINIVTNKIEMGRRTAQGWIVDVQSNVQIKPEQYYNMIVAVNGTTVTVGVDGKTYFSYAYTPRVVDGYSYGLNWGLVGVGSNNARGSFDNIRAQILPPAWTLQHTDDFSDGVANLFTGGAAGAWQVAGGRYQGTPAAGRDSGYSLVDLGIGRGVEPNSLIELSTTLGTQGMGGLIFDQYGADNFKFAAVDAATNRVVVGHYTTKRGWTIDASASKAIGTGDHTLGVTLKGTTVSVTLDGQTVLGYVYNAVGVDGGFGLLTRGGGSSFDAVTIKTDDPAFRSSSTAMMAAGAVNGTAPVDVLTESALAAMLDQAIQSGDDAIDLTDTVRVAVVDLTDGMLGQTQGSTIFVDDDAAGNGWFIDYQAGDAPVAAGRMDLLSVVAHELGHVLGLDHGDGIMDAALSPGMRLFVGDPGAPDVFATEETLADAGPMFAWNRAESATVSVTGGRIEWGRRNEQMIPQFPEIVAPLAGSDAGRLGFFSRLIDWTGRRVFGRTSTNGQLVPQFPQFLMQDEDGEEEGGSF